MEPLFNQENVNALLGHLLPESLAHDLVSAASTASAKDTAAATLEAILAKRVDEVREGLNGGS